MRKISTLVSLVLVVVVVGFVQIVTISPVYFWTAYTQRKVKKIGLVLRRIFLLKHVIDGKIAGMEIQRRRRKQLLNDLKEKRRYWKSK